jgi:hypothetical protein
MVQPFLSLLCSEKADLTAIGFIRIFLYFPIVYTSGQSTAADSVIITGAEHDFRTFLKNDAMKVQPLA